MGKPQDGVIAAQDSRDSYRVSSKEVHTATALHTLCDEELFARFAAGDDNAYTALYHRYGSRLLNYIRSLLGDGDAAADDLFQESFLRLFRERDRCQDGASDAIRNVGGWLFRVARNLVLNQIRSSRFLTPLPPSYDECSLVTLEEAHAHLFNEAPDEETLLHAVREVVDTLPAGLREVFILREVNGMSYHETAEIIGCSEEAARMRLSRARSAIRQALQSLFVDK